MSQGYDLGDLPLPPPPSSADKRNMKVIALAVVCVVLAASLVGFIVINPAASNLQSQIKDKNSLITNLQTQVENLTSQLSTADSDKTSLQTQVTSLDTELSNLTAQVNSAQSILTMQASESIISSAAETTANYTVAFDNTIPYSGYVAVQATSNSTTTYIQTIYNVSGVNYNQNVTVGKSGTTAFPVLPTTVEIRVGTTDKITDAITVTITYYY